MEGIMTSKEINIIYTNDLISNLKQLKENPKAFINIVTLNNLIIYLNGFCNGLIYALVKEANEDEYIFYKSPDTLVREYLEDSYLIPKTNKINTVDPNYTMVMYFKNKYPNISSQINEFIDLAIKCYGFERLKSYE